jgi:hypothetical protein
MALDPDFLDFIALLEKHKVEYLVVGGVALAAHGFPRFTGDLDVLVNPTKENSAKILAVLDEFGFKSLRLSEQDFTRPGMVIQLGVEPLRIDILTEIEAVEFSEAFSRRMRAKFGPLRANFIGKADLVMNKKRAGRPQDLVDVARLEGKRTHKKKERIVGRKSKKK